MPANRYLKFVTGSRRERGEEPLKRLVDLEGKHVDAVDVSIIDMAKEFSPEPFGVGPEDGEFNAQYFRQHILAPRLEDATGRVAVVLDGVDYPLSAGFIREVFEPLGSEAGLASNEVIDRVLLSENSPTDHDTRRLALRYVTQTAGD